MSNEVYQHRFIVVADTAAQSLAMMFSAIHSIEKQSNAPSPDNLEKYISIDRINWSEGFEEEVQRYGLIISEGAGVQGRPRNPIAGVTDNDLGIKEDDTSAASSDFTRPRVISFRLYLRDRMADAYREFLTEIPDIPDPKISRSTSEQKSGGEDENLFLVECQCVCISSRETGEQALAALKNAATDFERSRLQQDNETESSDDNSVEATMDEAANTNATVENQDSDEAMAAGRSNASAASTESPSSNPESSEPERPKTNGPETDGPVTDGAETDRAEPANAQTERPKPEDARPKNEEKNSSKSADKTSVTAEPATRPRLWDRSIWPFFNRFRDKPRVPRKRHPLSLIVADDITLQTNAGSIVSKLSQLRLELESKSTEKLIKELNLVVSPLAVVGLDGGLRPASLLPELRTSIMLTKRPEDPLVYCYQSDYFKKVFEIWTLRKAHWDSENSYKNPNTPGIRRVIHDSYGFDRYCDTVANLLLMERPADMVSSQRLEVAVHTLFEPSFASLISDTAFDGSGVADNFERLIRAHKERCVTYRGAIPLVASLIGLGEASDFLGRRLHLNQKK